MNKPNHIFRKFISFAYSAYKPYFYVVIFKAIITSALTIFNAYSLSIVIGTLEKADYKTSLMVGLIIILINLSFNFLTKLFNRLLEVEEKAMNEAIHRKITAKLMKVPFFYLEDPYYLDLKERAKFALENQSAISRFLNSVAELLQLIITLLGLFTIMLLFDYLLVIILIVAVILHVLMISTSLRTQKKFYGEIITINRKYGYYLTSLLDEKKAKDYRMYSIGKLLLNKFSYLGSETMLYFKRLLVKMGIIATIMEIIKYIEMAFVYSLVAIKTIVNKLPISSFSLYISTALTFSTSVTRLIDVGLNYLQTIHFLTPFVELIELKEERETGKQIPFTNKVETIEFEHVTFSYPRSKEIILNDITFKISRGEKISIVGLNGAGKTTLVKLLCRLYKPTKGNIYINGTSIYDYEFDSYINQISAVFQDYKLFAYTIKENIINNDNDEEAAYNVAHQVGLKEKLDSLPNGINSLYTKSYDEGGIELSGGESQKVAIARALYRDSSLVILDEPTSALDPLAEADIYQNFNNLVQDKTAIYISHRMSSSVFCDKILVIDGGTISDYDTHKNLMTKTDSLYYKLFMSQAKNYQR